MYLSTLANNRRLTSCFIHGRTPVRRAAILRRGSTRCITKRRKNARLSSPGGVVVIVVVVVMVVAGAESETRALIALAKITQPCCGYGKEGAGGGEEVDSVLQPKRRFCTMRSRVHERESQFALRSARLSSSRMNHARCCKSIFRRSLHDPLRFIKRKTKKEERSRRRAPCRFERLFLIAARQHFGDLTNKRYVTRGVSCITTRCVSPSRLVETKFLKNCGFASALCSREPRVLFAGLSCPRSSSEE